MESILKSIKNMLGISEKDDSFDIDIIIHINTALMTLMQLGVGPSDGFRIEDEITEWGEFISTDDKRYEAVKTYVYLKVKLVFDPPLNSYVLASMEQMAKEYEWRLNNAVETATS